MAEIRLDRTAGDSLALLFRLEHIILGVARRARAHTVHVVRVDNWFGRRWRFFKGTDGAGEDILESDRLVVPPFSKNRLQHEVVFASDGRVLRRLNDAQGIHELGVDHLDQIAERGVFVWYSSNTNVQDRASLMVYEVQAAGQAGWHVEFQRVAGTWRTTTTTGTSNAEIEALETNYKGLFAPLLEDEEGAEASLDYLRRAEDAYDNNLPATSRVLIEHYRTLEPESVTGALVHADVLVDLRNFDAAVAVLEEVGPLRSKRARLWEAWIWGQLERNRGRHEAEEIWRRRYIELAPDSTIGWIYLGSSQARRGLFKEAAETHRHATTRQGNPDEAFLNLGLVYRAVGRYAEAAEAFRNALRLCPDYPDAQQALDDVEAARSVFP